MILEKSLNSCLTPLIVDRKMLMKSLKSAPRSASPGRGGCTKEHLRTLLDDLDTFDFLLETMTSLAQASIPPEIATVLMGGASEASPLGGGWWPGLSQNCLHL